MTLAGCYETDESNGEKNTGSAEQKMTFRLGEASPRQESLASDTKGDTYTVTPTRVETGTKADMDKSGLDLDDLPGPRVPVYVWSTLTNHGAQPMRIREMVGDLVLRTEQGDRTKALLVMMGEATWPNCPDCGHRLADAERPAAVVYGGAAVGEVAPVEDVYLDDAWPNVQVVHDYRLSSAVVNAGEAPALRRHRV